MIHTIDDSELQTLVLMFLSEADEFIEKIEFGLIALEENPSKRSIIDEVFRAAHSLKGSSMAVGLSEVGSFTHELEALLLEVKISRTDISLEIIGILLKASDHLKVMICELKTNKNAKFDSKSLVEEIKIGRASCRERVYVLV